MRLRSSTSDSHANNAFLRMLKSTVLDTGIDMDKPFYYAGYNTGVNVISKEVKANTLKDVLKEFAQMWEELKLGTVELMEENKIQVKDCYQCGNMPNIGKLLCSSDIETKCWGQGMIYVSLRSRNYSVVKATHSQFNKRNLYLKLAFTYI